jgi:predicted outer membrane repeat protein
VLKNCTVSNNSASLGGGIASQGGPLLLTSCTVSTNSASLGGGIYVAQSTATLANCTLSNNSATVEGGGIVSAATMTITDSTLSNNSVTAPVCYGGGIYNVGTLAQTNSTLSGNSAIEYGGGIFSEGTVTLTSATVSNNSAGSGGGILDANETTLANTIVADNVLTGSGGLGPDVATLSSGVTSLGFNLIGNTAGSSGWVSSDLLNVNPLLAPLGNFGGPTQTVAILPGSPAIGAGNGAFVTNPPFAGPPFTDQRGDPRILDGKVDIGAFESQGFTISLRSGDGNSGNVGNVFAAPLVVSVASSDGSPVQGGNVTFTAPQSGPSCSFPSGTNAASIGAGGLASIAVAANGIVGGPYTVTATTEGAAGTVDFNLTNKLGPANQLVIQTEPSSSATAGQPFATQPVLYLEDQYGNLETDDNTTQVTASLREGTGPLLGTTTVTVSGGIATFTNLADNKAGNIALVFTGVGLAKATSGFITVNPAAASQLSISAPATASPGSSFTLTVTALDPYGNVAAGFGGTIHFESTDKLGSLPSNFTFTPADGGVHRFGDGVTLKTAGMQTITVIDTTNPSIMGSANVLVGSSVGICLTCYASSSIMGSANVLVAGGSPAPSRGALPLVNRSSAPRQTVAAVVWWRRGRPSVNSTGVVNRSFAL